MRRRFPRDGCVVPTAPLSRLVNDFVDGFRAQYEERRERAHGRRVGGVTPSAVAWLADATRRRDPHGRGVSESTITGVLAARYQVTEFRVADALVCAMGKVTAFYDGEPPTLPVVPNPLMKNPSCCGGSARMPF